MRKLKHLWTSWNPQATWQEAVRLIAIEMGICLAFIWAFEAAI
jgi:hypothetical protein